jgi:tRNA A-37 threonylcarbamoyl transferase component Bud32
MRTTRRTSLGPFLLEEKIGEGGMGVVYRARDPQLRRLVAIKRIHDRYEKDENYCRRFLGEARAVAAVSHPNIAQIYSIHGSEGGEPPFFAMEYVEGLSADARVRRDGPLPLPLAIDIAVQAARGLRAAQQRGIVHRDVKPSNLLLDDRDQVKLVDFGLAFQVGDLTAPQDEEDEILCTPHYVSPEQARGWWVDHRSDIYSLGCTLYFLVTGREPFQRPSRVDLFVAHANERPPPASSLRPEVPESLDQLIGRMLEKRPEDRPADYDELLVSLGVIREELEPLAVRRPGSARARGIVAGALGMAAIAAAVWVARRDPESVEFPVEQHFRGAYIAGEPFEKLHFDFTPGAAVPSSQLARHFISAEESAAPNATRPEIRDGVLRWSNFAEPVRLPYLSEFQEIELRGLRFLHRQDFRIALGVDEEWNDKDCLEVVLAVNRDEPNERIVRCIDRGEEVPLTTEPPRLDFRVKSNESYILRLLREPSGEAGVARFRFILAQETPDGRAAEQASVSIRLPADRLPRGRIVLQSQCSWPNRWTVSVEEILVRGTLDRERLAIARAAGEI